MQELEEFVAQIRHLALQLQPSARAKLLRTIATELRRRNRERIRANVEPDGKPMAKRQGDRFMFRRIRDGEGLNGRPFRFSGKNTATITQVASHTAVQKTAMSWSGLRESEIY